MPLYEFICTEETCNHTEELMLKVQLYTDTKEKMTCPKCNSKALPAVSVPHFRLIGGGWARDQYTNSIRNENAAALKEYDIRKKAEERNSSREMNIEMV